MDRLVARFVTTVGRLARGDPGEDLIEYGLLVALIAVVAMAAVTSLGERINTVLWVAIANNF